MDISVIIPTYKPKDYLWECLDSLCNQSFSKENFEVLLVLNGERELYERQIRDYMNRHQDLHIVPLYSNKQGVSAARNKGLDNAKGTYITFIDDDDYVSKTYLDELYIKSSQNVVCLAYPYAFNDGYPDVQLKYGITEEYERCAKRKLQYFTKPKKYFSGPCMKLIHKDVIGDRRFDERFRNGEDSLFMFLVSDKFKNVDFTSRRAVYYRRYRINSAVTLPQKKIYWIKNAIRMCMVYTSIYFRSYPNYNILFYLTRMLGTVHMSLHKIL